MGSLHEISYHSHVYFKQLPLQLFNSSELWCQRSNCPKYKHPISLIRITKPILLYWVWNEIEIALWAWKLIYLRVNNVVCCYFYVFFIFALLVLFMLLLFVFTFFQFYFFKFSLWCLRFILYGYYFILFLIQVWFNIFNKNLINIQGEKMGTAQTILLTWLTKYLYSCILVYSYLSLLT